MRKGTREVIARRYLISGRVQGVGYRFFAEREANRLGVRGYVRNRADGRVEAYGVGHPGVLVAFKQRLAEGPYSAIVRDVEESDEPVDSRYGRFVIERSI